MCTTRLGYIKQLQSSRTVADSFSNRQSSINCRLELKLLSARVSVSGVGGPTAGGVGNE